MSHSFPSEPPRHLPVSCPGRVRDVLDRWLWVLAAKDGRETWHVLGYRRSDGVPYITSPLVAADPILHRVHTHSGSTYVLGRQTDLPDPPLNLHLWTALRLWRVEI